MPKPTNTQELTARYLAAGAGFNPEEQFKALLNAASHVAKPLDFGNSETFFESSIDELMVSVMSSDVMEPLADDKAPF